MQERYSRQMLFSGIGEEGQALLQNKHVLVIGAGALGTGNAEILVRSGVGTITIADRDYVEWSNLQRQQLYTEEDARNHMPKAIAAKKRLETINSDVKINAHIVDITPLEMEQFVHGIDLIIDATDNFDIRMIMNDISQKYAIPWIYGSIVASYGVSFTVIPGTSPCLHCLMEDVPIGGMTCDTGGVISPVVQLVVAHQTAEALKILTENWEYVRRELISFDLWTNQHASINVSKVKKAACSSCGSEATYPFLTYDNKMKTAVLCGRDTVQIRPAANEQRDLETVAASLSKLGKVEQNDFLLQFKTGENRMVMFKDGRVLVHGTNDEVKAKSLYHKYLA
ncbi:thiazole biosynthesis adenylyltransferase ThiF [Lentibacillus cibarius]|uniref:Thiazole biosynthesis adenylyltransferase ThiF n=1 Tax=Lentibacillus cibarius TaxID=2583219 RepID=A0A5S3QHU6_9BACI|nr:thiazole biosynthesis adenylyltransferase ThiF [Lentibacillus cibarius]TMN20741.1 thiazole biosynthesis adenylyltransferase ThiF [Lentibacillus cibarius]